MAEKNRSRFDSLATEAANNRSAMLDDLRPIDIVSLLVDEEKRTAQAVWRERKSIAAAAVRIARSLRSGGRLIYVGAGTSGRLAMLDAVECPPTFSTLPSQVVAVVAGGPRALVRAVEGAEDDARECEERLRRLALAPPDILCAIAASGVTPFALAALDFAKRRGCQTIFVTCGLPARAKVATADEVIAPRVGPEVLSGSTRLKAGTATKLVLNALSTTAMVGLGKVYGNQMVDLRQTSAKLRARALRIVRDLCDFSDDGGAERLLARAGGSVQVAIVMHHRRVSKAKARALLEEKTGWLRPIVGDLHGRKQKHGTR